MPKSLYERAQRPITLQRIARQLNLRDTPLLASTTLHQNNTWLMQDYASLK